MTPPRLYTRRGLVEALQLGLLYAGYTASRLAAEGGKATAADNAATILGAERSLGMDVESAFNAALSSVRWLEVVASYWYSSLHYVVTAAVLVLLWRRRPRGYVTGRNVLVLATLLALVGFLMFPTAPPRLMPGYVDTLSATADAGWWAGAGSVPQGVAAATNELAAMPSMHVGWAFWAAFYVCTLTTRRWLRALAWAYPVITTLVVVATANHWLLDAVAGIALVLAADTLVRAARPEPAGGSVPRQALPDTD